MAFNFNKPATTGASSNSLFGTTNNNTGGAPFGGVGGGGTATGTPTFSFSPSPAAAIPGEQKSLFGTAGGQTSNIFGSQSGSTSNAFSFGKKAEENKTTEPPKSPFGGLNTTSQPPATPGSSAPSLFGSTTPAAATKPTWTFGNPSTTPAGPPPQPTTFGASTGGGGIFGNTQTQQSQPSQDTSKQPAFSFMKPTSSAAPTATATTQAAPTPSLFGGPPQIGAAGGLPGSKTADKPAESSSAGGLFGAKPADSSSSGGLFGAKPADKPAEPKPASTSIEAPKPTFSFGPPASTTPVTGATTSNATPSLFGNTQASAATTTSQPTAPLFGKPPAATQASGSLFGAPQSAPSATSNLFSKPATTSSSEPSSKPMFSFAPASTEATAMSSSSTNALASAPKPLFGSLGGGNTIQGVSSSSNATQPSQGAGQASTSVTAAPAASAAPGSLFTIGGTTSNSSSQPSTTTAATTSTTPAPTSVSNTNAGAGTSTLGASTTGPVPPAQSRLKNKSMDEILTRWATDLTRYTKDFKNHAETIAHWDQVIVDNSSKIDKLYVKTRTCEKQTMSVEMQLAAVENQQSELESWISKYENDVEEMLAKDVANQTELGGPDQERERTYQLAEKLGEQLEDMGQNLESMVEEVNATNASLSKHTKADEPITQIVRILNSHLTQLQSIDQGTAALQAKVTAAQKSAMESGYLNGGANADGRAAVDDFYRSYIGRR